jgi:hypothetical protein
MMQRYGTLEQGTWNANETFEYRFEVNEKEGLFACLARLRGGLYVSGFAVGEATTLEKHEDANEIEWIRPSNLLAMVDAPRFAEKR